MAIIHTSVAPVREYAYGLQLIHNIYIWSGEKSPRRSIFNTLNTLFLGKNKLKQLKLHKNKATVRRIE